MAAPIRKTEISQSDAGDHGSPGVAQNPPAVPAEGELRGMKRRPEPTLGQQIRAHTNRPHKGDVGRPGTNEEVFQGSKTKELK